MYNFSSAIGLAVTVAVLGSVILAVIGWRNQSTLLDFFFLPPYTSFRLNGDMELYRDRQLFM